ncbi:hypothetical protein BJ944DRAFT_252834 [Cunninghamella echinulata]|nr:hypothetical protein BJ944DRAFT_252834 [Cunninghamella echinulata]
MTSETTINKTISKKSNVGRHRLYSNEQRKDRNRQAQAAFRQRRSVYTKTLEETVEKLQSIIASLQQSTDEANKRAEVAENRYIQLESEYNAIRNITAYYLPQELVNKATNSPSPSNESAFSPPIEISSPVSTFSNDINMSNNILNNNNNNNIPQNLNLSTHLENSLPNNLLGEYYV